MTWRSRSLLAIALLACGACGADEQPGPWTSPDLLIVDHYAGVFRYDAARGETRLVAGEDDGLRGPRRAVRLDDGRISILASGDDAGQGRALYLYDDETGSVTPWIDLSGPWIPTDVLQIGESTLLMSTRQIEGGPELVKTSALHEIDMDDGSVRLVLESPELLAVLSLFPGEDDHSVLVLDGDANPRGLPKYEGVLFRYDLESGALTTVREFENTVSPLQLLPLAGTVLAGQAEYLLVDVNAHPPPEKPWIGALFLMDAAEGEVRPFLVDEEHLIDPVRGFLYRDRLVVAEMSTNPGHYDTVKTSLSYAGFRGRGAVYTVDLATREVEPLVHDPGFLDPVDVLPLP